MFNNINKIFLSLLVLLILVLVNAVVGGWVATLITAASWVSILFGCLLGLFVLWVDVQVLILAVLYVKKKFSNTKNN